MRIALFSAAVLLLSACTPPAPTPQAPAPTPDASAPNPNLAALSADPLFGSWITQTSETGASACFGAPESECTLVLACDIASGRVSISWSHELFPDQDVELKLITASETLSFLGRSFNEGLPIVNAETNATRLAALAQPQAWFGVEVEGEVSVLPWQDNVVRVVEACQ